MNRHLISGWKEIQSYPAIVAAAFLVSFAMTVWGYAGTCHFPFVFDDLTGIVNNPAVTNFGKNGLRGLLAFAPERIFGFLTFVFSWSAGGADPCTFRKANLLIHVLAGGFCGMSALNLMRLTGLSKGMPARGALGWFVPLAAAGLFAAHSVQTQAVTYIYQRLASLTGCFGLAAFSFLTLWLIRPAAWRWWLAFVFCALAMLTKPNAAMLPLFFLLATVCFKASSVVQQDRSHFFRLPRGTLPFLALPALIPLLMLAGSGIGQRIVSHGTDGLGPLQYFLVQGRVIWNYLFVILWPAAQSVDHIVSIPGRSGDVDAWLGMIGWAGVSGSLIVAGLFARDAQRNPWLRIAAFGVCWFFGCLMVESSFIPIRDVMMEHRLYLPFAGLAWAFVAMSAFVMERWQLNSRRMIIGAGIALIAVVSLASVASHRNQIWESSRALWSSVLLTDPQSVRARLNLGNALLRDGEYGEALAQYEQLDSVLSRGSSINDRAVAAELPYQRIMAWILLRRFDDARREIGQLDVSAPAQLERKAYIAAFLAWAQGDYRACIAHLEAHPFEGGLWRDVEMLRIRATDRLGNDLSLSGEARGKFQSAERQALERLLQRQPLDPEALIRMARFLALTGDGMAAQELLARSAVNAGSLYAPWFLLVSAELLEDPQHPEAALAKYRESLRRFPGHSGLRTWMGSFLALLGDQDAIHQSIGGAMDIDLLADDALSQARLLAGSFQFDEAVIVLRRALRLCDSGPRRCSRSPALSEALAGNLLLFNPSGLEEVEALLARSRNFNPDLDGQGPDKKP